jgi:hypothetical protein
MHDWKKILLHGWVTNHRNSIGAANLSRASFQHNSNNRGKKTQIRDVAVLQKFCFLQCFVVYMLQYWKTSILWTLQSLQLSGLHPKTPRTKHASKNPWKHWVTWKPKQHCNRRLWTSNSGAPDASQAYMRAHSNASVSWYFDHISVLPGLASPPPIVLFYTRWNQTDVQGV